MRVRLSWAIVLCAGITSSAFVCGCKTKHHHATAQECDPSSGCTPPAQSTINTAISLASVAFTIPDETPAGHTVSFNVPVTESWVFFRDQKITGSIKLADPNGAVPSDVPAAAIFSLTVRRGDCPTEDLLLGTITFEFNSKGQSNQLHLLPPSVPRCLTPQPLLTDPAVLYSGDMGVVGFTPIKGAFHVGSVLTATMGDAGCIWDGCFPPASTDGGGCTANGGCTSIFCSSLGTCAQPPLLTLACPTSTATFGGSYASAFVPSGGVPPYISFSITQGGLPSGLNLNSGTGMVSGSPTASGAFTFVATFKDAAGNTSSSGVCVITSN